MNEMSLFFLEFKLKENLKNLKGMENETTFGLLA